MSLDPRAIESLLAFWAEAGVHAALAEAPIDRTAAAARPGPGRPAPAPAPAARGAASASAARREVSMGLAPEPPRADDDAAAEARRAAGAADTLEALALAIAAFEGCALKAGASRSVFSRGRADAPVMVIGEAPGAEEDARGEPFVGRAGQLLDRMLSAAGLEGRVFITNTVFWRPPGNRTPTPAEQAVCAPFLERAIALVRPRVLLLAGGAAAKAMLKRTEGILSLRGRWIEWRSEDGRLEIPALPTLHPSFLLRQPAAKRKSWEDMLILAERVDRPARPR
jgi:DNA polymerase